MRTRVSLSVLCMSLFAASARAQTVWYVDDDGGSKNGCTSWEDACPELQTALSLAEANDQVWVAAGTYKPDYDVSTGQHTGDRGASFLLANGVAFYGGFDGTEQSLEDRAGLFTETILSADLAGDDGSQPFYNNQENSFHVVSTAIGAGDASVLDGFLVIGGNANGDGNDKHGGGLFIVNGDPTIRNCIFMHHFADIRGGAIYVESGAPTFVDCAFNDNYGSVGGAIQVRYSSGVTFRDCVFSGNQAYGGGGMFVYYSDFAVIGSQFCNNTAWGSAGGVFNAFSQATILNCLFVQNSAGNDGGGLIDVGDAVVINTVFSRNTANIGGGMLGSSETSLLVNTTFSHNTGSGLTTMFSDAPTLVNCILWGNMPEQITGIPSDTAMPPTLYFCDVEGGWSGPGSDNTNEDPLFVQAGTDNVRLSFGSPCVDAGDNSALPPDDFDLDNDGNTTETLPIDLDGNARIENGVVEMGAYEGENEQLPPAANQNDFDSGDFAVLLPCGGVVEFLEHEVVFALNSSGQNNAFILVACLQFQVHPDAGGFSELGPVLAADTSLPDGDFQMYVFIPFDVTMLGGGDPQRVNLTEYDDLIGDWTLAVAGNSQPSPGHSGPIGDRIVVQSTDNDFGLSGELGDYGVFWNPEAQKGFAWANVDHDGDFAIGASLCASDTAPPGGDGVIQAADLGQLLGWWGACEAEDPCRSADTDDDGIIGAFDLAALLGDWGPCR